jgi:hypothetical protein
VLGRCSGRFSSHIVGDIKPAGGLLEAAQVNLLPVFEYLVSASHHSPENGGEVSFGRVFGLSSGSELACAESPWSSGACRSKKIPLG